MDERRVTNRTKQTIAERRGHHRTREDRQRKTHQVLLWRARTVTNPRTGHLFNVEAARRDAENIERKVVI